MARNPVSDSDKAERKLARELGFHSGVRGQRELRNFQSKVGSLPRNDPRFVPPEGINDLYMLKVARGLDRRHKTPVEAFLKKKEALIDTPELKNHMSSGAFLDRYREAIMAMLADDTISGYQKRKLRGMLRQLNTKRLAGDDAPLPPHIAKNDKSKVEDRIRRAAERKRQDFMQVENARKRQAQDKENRAREKKYGKKTKSRKMKKQGRRFR